jgi:hypothetical protein
MNLKEFDYKQFLLEKGEQVGLGVAVTLMVLMLIFSLFMPSKGFFSGSPKEKAAKLEKDSKELEVALRTRDIPDNEKPEPTEGRLIDLDTAVLWPKNYEVPSMYQPAVKENPDRRPPRIYTIEEGVVADAHVLIDTYLFSTDFKNIWVLRESGRTQANPGGPGATNNPFARFGNMGRGGPGGGPGGAPMMGRGARGMMNIPQGAQQLLRGPASNDAAEDYKPTLIRVEDWNPQDLTARQPRPLRVAVIAGSFPYRRQLEAFKSALHMSSNDEVLNEDMHEEKLGKSFEFRGVEIQKREVGADGKDLTEWDDLKLATDYRNWLKVTYLPFQEEEDPNYNLVEMEGLTAPLLREFHPDKKVDPTMQMPGGMMARKGGPAPQPTLQPTDAGDGKPKTHYPDLVKKLPKLQATLKHMTEVPLAHIAAPKTRPGDYDFDPFRPNAEPAPNAAEQTKDAKKKDGDAVQDFVPDHVLVRAVDVNVEPGKRYRYRLRIKMNNPNYMRSEVASPEYKVDEILKSQEWFEIKEAVGLPPELHYYVVDEKKLVSEREKNLISRSKVSALSRLWAQPGPSVDQVVMQFHRWVEYTPVGRNDVVPVGDWAVADRVCVARGEYVGRKVKIDLPIWKYTRNAYLLPAEDPKTTLERKLALTGLDVDFGFDNKPDEDTILIDFEGGRVAGPAKMSDDCRTEILMLSPDGKLLARNSAKDTEDQDRKDQREKVLKRIENIRAGRGAE